MLPWNKLRSNEKKGRSKEAERAEAPGLLGTAGRAPLGAGMPLLSRLPSRDVRLLSSCVSGYPSLGTPSPSAVVPGLPGYPSIPAGPHRAHRSLQAVRQVLEVSFQGAGLSCSRTLAGSSSGFSSFRELVWPRGLLCSSVPLSSRLSAFIACSSREGPANLAISSLPEAHLSHLPKERSCRIGCFSLRGNSYTARALSEKKLQEM